MAKRKRTEEQATQWTKEREQKVKQHNDQKKRTKEQAVTFLLAIVLLVLLSFSSGHCVTCSSVLFFWPLCYLSFCPFLFVIVLLVLLSFLNNTMAKEKGQKDKQHNSQKKMAEAQATPWPKEMDRRTSKTSCHFFLSLCCLSFCPFSFGHCVACSSVIFFWPLCQAT
jgi:uncharacterized membrane protein